MLYYDRIDISEGIDPTKSNKRYEFMICHYWCFNHWFKFEDSVRSGCHDLTMSRFDNIITVKDIDYRRIIHYISKSEAINLLQNSVFEDRKYI